MFRVTRVEPPTKQSFEQAGPTIKQLLAAEKQHKALEDFVTRFRRKRKAKTECSEGYVTPDCKNGPAAAPTNTSLGAG